jgi:hypothetical protein
MAAHLIRYRSQLAARLMRSRDQKWRLILCCPGIAQNWRLIARLQVELTNGSAFYFQILLYNTCVKKISVASVNIDSD